ncbi:stealth family protein [Streptococcus sobrinus]|uniref:stealth family protein n=1 Tax=Streptococcus sobrinus TaxID=1310 RepID=UPI000317CBAF|nr:stealth family protein [Streptococcus sobrinus]
MAEIDFVVTWVDGQDPAWLKTKSKYEPATSVTTKESDSENRYRVVNSFRYWFRSVEKYAPWVNKIFFVTYGHVPDWLDTSHPKLCLVRHEDYIPKDYLPTFNSNVIELNLHRISDLSEHFVLFSDDMILNQPLKPDDFFHKGLPRLLAIYRPIVAQSEFSHIEVNNTRFLNKYFLGKPNFKRHLGKYFNYRYGKFNLYNFLSLFYSGIMGYEDAHVGLPSLKSTYADVWEKEGTYLDEMCHNRFRSSQDLNHWAMSYWNIETNRFYPQTIKIGKYVPIADKEKIAKIVGQSSYKMVCINDDESSVDFQAENAWIEQVLAEKIPEKSSFEK